MKTKTKLIVSITSLCLVVVAAIISVVTVFALINNGINIGGSITFTAKNIYATVSAATLSGGSLEDADNKLQQIDYNATSDGSAALATWSDLNLTFPESGEDVTITFSVANNSTTEALRVSVGELTGTAKNATMAVAITGKDAGTTTVVIPAKTGESAESAEFVITFHITDKNESASIKDFDIPLTIEEYTGYLATINFSAPYSAMDESFYWELLATSDSGEQITIPKNAYFDETSYIEQHILSANTITFSLDNIIERENDENFVFNISSLQITISNGTEEYSMIAYTSFLSGTNPIVFTLTEDTTISVIYEYIDGKVGPELVDPEA